MPGELPTIAQLECFIIYGRVGNFARAAREANITQSAFSAQIKHLETTLGVTLIHRSKRGRQLTEEGKLFLARITGWIDGLRKIVYDTRATAETKPTELNVGILRSLGDIHMNRHIAHFRRDLPSLRFNVLDLPTYQIHRALTEGRLDVVSTYFVKESLPQKARPGDFTIIHFCTDNLVYYAPLLKLEESRLTREQILTLDKFKEKSADNLLNAIERCDLAAFEPLVERHLYGGIRRLGSKLTEEYADYFEPEK